VRGFAYLTAVVLVVIGVGVSFVGGLSAANASATCLADLVTIGNVVPMPTPTRVTTTVPLAGGYELVPAPTSYSPRIPPAAAWTGTIEPSKETTATYQLLLGRFVVPDSLSGSMYSDVIGWVPVGEHIAAIAHVPGAAGPGTCFFASAFVVYNATTGHPLFGG